MAAPDSFSCLRETRRGRVMYCRELGRVLVLDGPEARELADLMDLAAPSLPY